MDQPENNRLLRDNRRLLVNDQVTSLALFASTKSAFHDFNGFVKRKSIQNHNLVKFSFGLLFFKAKSLFCTCGDKLAVEVI